MNQSKVKGSFSTLALITMIACSPQSETVESASAVEVYSDLQTNGDDTTVDNQPSPINEPRWFKCNRFAAKHRYP